MRLFEIVQNQFKVETPLLSLFHFLPMRCCLFYVFYLLFLFNEPIPPENIIPIGRIIFALQL